MMCIKLANSYKTVIGASSRSYLRKLCKIMAAF